MTCSQFCCLVLYNIAGFDLSGKGSPISGCGLLRLACKDHSFAEFVNGAVKLMHMLFNEQNCDPHISAV